MCKTERKLCKIIQEVCKIIQEHACCCNKERVISTTFATEVITAIFKIYSISIMTHLEDNYLMSIQSKATPK